MFCKTKQKREKNQVVATALCHTDAYTLDGHDPDFQRGTNEYGRKRLGDPTDIATCVLYLVRDAPYVTGQIIAVDGGRSVGW